MVAVAVVGCGRTGFDIEDARESAGQGQGEQDEPEPDDLEEPDPPPPTTCGNGVVDPGELCFDEQLTFASRIDPCAIDVADLDGDGHLDIAVPNSDFDHIESEENFATILYGDGRGGLSAPLQLLAGGDFAVGLEIGTFTPDATPDLVIANSDTSEINLIFGEGGRGFIGPDPVEVGEGPVQAAAGDFDGDGLDDIAVTVRNAGGISVVLNDGTGAFTQPADFYAAGEHTWGLTSVDLDADGNVDLVATDAEGASIHLYRGRGDGTFTAGGALRVGFSPRLAVADDVDADGDLDLLVANNDEEFVSLLRADGAGGYDPAEDLEAMYGGTSIALGDFNADGHRDFVLLSNTDDALQFHLGNSTGAFHPARTYALGEMPSGVAAGDFNEDGIDDLAVSNQLDNNVGLVLSNP